jgi:NADPH-dependent 7-cyano-7-deazaguanine reductase QueF
VTADPSLLRTVPDTSGALVTVTGPLVHRCPHVEEVDAGTVTITWRCADLTLELHALTAYLASWQAQAVSHEELTAQIVADLERVDGIDDVDVRTRWSTAGLSVTVDR